jgi:hypothetical protein
MFKKLLKFKFFLDELDDVENTKYNANIKNVIFCF